MIKYLTLTFNKQVSFFSTMHDAIEYLENITFALNFVIFIMSYFRDKIYLQDVAFNQF